MDYKLRVVTYNVNNQKPGDETYSSLLGDEVKNMPDFIAVGLQEVKTFQEEWSSTFEEEMSRQDYILVNKEWFSSTHLLFWCKKEHRHRVLNVETCHFICGNLDRNATLALTMTVMPAGLAGAVSKGVTLTFVCSHFSAHLENYDLRCQEYRQVLRDISFKEKDILKHDYVIWFGDLNFRINDLSAEQVKQLVESKELEQLKGHDQLLLAMKSQTAFHDFKEEEISFKPTYKTFNGTNEYNLQRVPSFTDRILFRMSCEDDLKHMLKIDKKNGGYKCFEDFKISDHKPVVASFVFRAFV